MKFPIVLLLLAFALLLVSHPTVAVDTIDNGILHVPSVQIDVRETESNKHLGTLIIQSGEKLSKLLRLDKTNALKFTFSIVNQVANGQQSVADVQQAFLRFWHTKANDHEVFFIAKAVGKKEKGNYALELNMAFDIRRFRDRPGRYHCELIIGDRRFRDGHRWMFADAFVDVPKAPEPEPKSYQIRDRTPKMEMQPELHHTFRPVERCNAVHFPLIWAFTLFCAIPMAFFLNSMCRPLLGTSIQTMFATPKHLLFLMFLTAIFAIYAIGWLFGWSVALTFKILPIFIIPCFICGHRSLKMIANERMKQEEKKEKDEQEEQEKKEKEEQDITKSNYDADLLMSASSGEEND